MPLTRYQVRNEYSLADPELYRDADKDDPEALLEGVAMAGLVGVLRQLGDLAEFAAEIFHDLHEEVMVTAARGHGLMVRVQQLEAEVPSIEKEFLSKTSHSLFFSNAGVDWHPNLRAEQNLITRGDLPRFVMDSYEECRGPPRLFLLDKFDVAGAGSCLKRYTDPSFFKVEATSYGTATAEVQREKKIRKVKKKGSRWRNGETPEVQPTSHAKLQQLFLEERVGTGYSDPARLVKLKKRQLNGATFDSKKSYMEKFLETPTPEQKVVHEISVISPVTGTVDNGSESGLEIVEISTVSPPKKLSQGEESANSSPEAQELVSRPHMDKLNGEAIEGKIVKVPEPVLDGETDDVSSTIHQVAVEKELTVDGIDGYHSDDVTSEIDNYMDALTTITMDSEMETDNECRPKNDLAFLNAKKQEKDTDANEKNQEFQAQFSDSQSIGNSSASDYGNSSFKNNRSSFSDSDTVSSLAENTASVSDGVAKVFHSTETCAAEIVDMPSSQVMDEHRETKSHDLAVPNITCIEEEKITDLGEASCSSRLTDSIPVELPLDHGACSSVDLLVGPEVDETTSDCIKLGSKILDTGENETNLVDSTAVVSDVPSHSKDDIHFTVSEKSHLDGEDPNVVSDVFLHFSDVSEGNNENKSIDNSLTEVLQTESADDDSSGNLVNEKIGSANLSTSPTERQFFCSPLLEVEECSDVMPITCSSDVVELDGVVSKADDAIMATGVNSEDSAPMVESPQIHTSAEQQFSNLMDNVPRLELSSAEMDVPCSEKRSDIEELPRGADGEEKGTFTVDTMGGDAVPLELPSSDANYLCHEDHVNFNSVVTKPVIAVDKSLSAVSVASADDDLNDVICKSTNMVCPPSENLINLQESLSEIVDSHQKGLEFNEAVSPACLAVTEAPKKENQLEVAPADTLCKSVSSDYCNVKTFDDVHESSLAEQTQNSLSDSDGTTSPTYSEPSNQQSYSPHQSHLLENGGDKVSSPTFYLPEPGVPLEQSLELEADRVDMESLQDDGANYNSSNPQSEQIQSLNHIDQERCERMQSSNHIYQERCFDTPESCPEHLLIQPSASEFLPQSAGLELDGTKQAMNPFESNLSAGLEPDGTKQAMNPFESNLPSFALLPEAAQVNLEEIPPLPPLPPMQWRMGKVQNTSLASQRELAEASQDAFPPLQPFVDEKAQFDFPASKREILWPQNLDLPIIAVEDENFQQVSEDWVSNLPQPTPLTLLLPAMVNDDSQSNCLALEGTQTQNPFLTSTAIPIERPEHDFLTLEGTQTQNPFLTSTAIPIERPEHDFLALEGEKAQSSSDLFPPVPIVEHTTSTHDSESSQEKLIEPLNQLRPDTCFDDNTLQPTPQNYSESDRGNPFDTSMPPPTMEVEQVPHAPLTSDGETTRSLDTSAQAPGFEDGKPNGNPAIKIPRPRSPLIDAVAAHDKSKLRKVAERVRPRIGPKVDERDSLLEQIRTKSFNLKPAMVTRPSIHGPNTNLKVAAILEKAKTIRQAFAGSDEDDDSDAWSDS